MILYGVWGMESDWCFPTIKSRAAAHPCTRARISRIQGNCADPLREQTPAPSRAFTGYAIELTILPTLGKWSWKKK